MTTMPREISLTKTVPEKLAVNKKVLRTLNLNEAEEVSGGRERTNGTACIVIGISLQICPTESCSDVCGSGGTPDAGCTTGGGETYNCGGVTYEC
ncbi:class II lanthipeptide, LchA2/BrtA2 family [Massilia sp. DJPM01]|uniref:class II lanthipeptide, LchA2/BrtA2 family n=1 Tax=Massilia sp. DJPM01 TaxID=3024404 RepID=UPI00259F66AC|nr:class II lanthipeptide, LchA2/BrtA2 family [Massilia sp. DJPM01]MDM5181100.1 class II lanthipeptide, LchA2/BrtA2 family [Massilia sp. DJPM01]